MAISKTGMKRLVVAAKKRAGGKQKNELANKFASQIKKQREAAAKMFTRVSM